MNDDPPVTSVTVKDSGGAVLSAFDVPEGQRTLILSNLPQGNLTVEIKSGLDEPRQVDTGAY